MPSSVPAESGEANLTVSRALNRLAEIAELQALWSKTAKANGELRFATGLRRGWREARAEAAVLSAMQVARAQGAVVPAMRLRHILADPEQASTPSEMVALAAWRMQAQLLELMSDLNPGRMARPGAGLQGLSVRSKQVVAEPQYAQLVSAFGRDWLATFGSTERHQTITGLVPGLELPAAQAQLVRQICESSAPAWVRAAVAHATLATSAGNTGAGRAAAAAISRALLIASGVDRPGVILPDWLAALDPTGYSQALADYVSGSSAGVQSWLTWYLRALERGVLGGQRIAKSVLAQVPWDGLS